MRTGMTSLTLLFAAALATPSAANEQRVVHYEPEQVQLTGTVKRRSFLINPGTGHETLEVKEILELDEAVQVASSSGRYRIETSEFQIAGATPELLAESVGRRVKLTGTLFPPHNKRHFTKVLVFARRIEKL